jgi:hypothetical protein
VQWGLLADSASSITHVEELLESIERYPDLIITDHRLHDGKTAHDVTESVYRKLGKLVPCLVITIPLHTSLLLDLAHVPDAGNEVHYSLHA